jgi:hypothetical protein
MNTMRAAAAIRRVGGTSSPTAPRISQTPVKVTIKPGFGTDGGTIAIMSARMLLKWAAAVKQSITARPSRVHAAQSRQRNHTRVAEQAGEQHHTYENDQRRHGWSPIDVGSRTARRAGARRNEKGGPGGGRPFHHSTSVTRSSRAVRSREPT